MTTLFLTIGIAAILIEVFVLQFATGWFLFIGLGAIATSLLTLTGFVTDVSFAFVWFAIFSIGFTAFFWKKLPTLLGEKDSSLDMVGQKVHVTEEISKNSEGKISWSGTEWKAAIDSEEEKADFSKGETVIITKVEGITVFIKTL